MSSSTSLPSSSASFYQTRRDPPNQPNPAAAHDVRLVTKEATAAVVAVVVVVVPWYLIQRARMTSFHYPHLHHRSSQICPPLRPRPRPRRPLSAKGHARLQSRSASAHAGQSSPEDRRGRVRSGKHRLLTRGVLGPALLWGEERGLN